MPTADLLFNLRDSATVTFGELRAKSSPQFNCIPLFRQRASNKLPRLHLNELRRISRLQAERVEAEVARRMVRADLPVHLETHRVRMTAGQADTCKRFYTLCDALRHAQTLFTLHEHRRRPQAASQRTWAPTWFSVAGSRKVNTE